MLLLSLNHQGPAPVEEYSYKRVDKESDSLWEYSRG